LLQGRDLLAIIGLIGIKMMILLKRIWKSLSNIVGRWCARLRNRNAKGETVSVDKKTAWMEYGRRLYDSGIAVLAEADTVTVGAKVRDPKVLAMALLTRTLSNFNGAHILIDAGMIVEARTLTRCCFENLLWLAELAARRETFVEEMVRDQVSSQQARGKMVLSWGDKIEDAVVYEDSHIPDLRAPAHCGLDIL
jgi:hypothetical protein